MKLAEVKPTDEELRVILESGFVLREAGRFDDAAKIFRGMCEMLPSSDVPLVGLGTVALQHGRPEEALVYCEEALRVKPDSLYARVHYAEALLFCGKRDEAEEELRQVIERGHDTPHSHTAQALLAAADLITRRAAQAII